MPLPKTRIAQQYRDHSLIWSLTGAEPELSKAAYMRAQRLFDGKRARLYSRVFVDQASELLQLANHDARSERLVSPIAGAAAAAVVSAELAAREANVRRGSGARVDSSEATMPQRGGSLALPPFEVAFAGRSNVGKSSLLNAVMANDRLALTSSTPGRTQNVFFFHAGVDSAPVFISDLPGFGYAEAPDEAVRKWHQLIRIYVTSRAATQSLKRIFFLVDARHGFGKREIEFLDILDGERLPYQIVFTKLDRSPRVQFESVLRSCLATLAEPGRLSYPHVLAVSSHERLGIANLRYYVAAALGHVEPP
jgi:GTP-binding protein